MFVNKTKSNDVPSSFKLKLTPKDCIQTLSNEDISAMQGQKLFAAKYIDIPNGINDNNKAIFFTNCPPKICKNIAENNGINNNAKSNIYLKNYLTTKFNANNKTEPKTITSKYKLILPD